MKNVYIFSGLGADKRVFQHMDFTYCNAIFIDWLSPKKNESISNYASRICSQIKHENPVLIGLSFGGIMAVEVAKLVKTEKVILIASAKNRSEIPWYYRMAGKFNLHKLLPTKLMKTPNVLSYWLFGIENSDDKKLLKEILNDTYSTFLKWAINAIATLTNKIQPTNVIHIHGTADRILPIKFAKVDAKVENGGHFMTLNKAKEVSEIVRDVILKLK